MESLAALGLAANIVQFVHFGATLLSETSELYHSATGASIGNAELESITKNVQKLSEGLEASPHDLGSSEQENTLRNLSNQCKRVSAELLAVLEELRVMGQHRRWQSFKQAVKGIRSKKKIDELDQRVHKLQNGIITCLLVMMK